MKPQHRSDRSREAYGCKRDGSHWRRLAAAVVLSATSVLYAQSPPDYQPDKNWQVTCDAAKSEPLKRPPLTDSLPASKLPGCDERALYYGFDGKPDYAAALQCGWYEYAHPQDKVGNMFYGPGVLAMLYANGRGVERDYGMAIRFACEEQWVSESGQEYRIAHLLALRNSPEKKSDFDLCDDDGSGLSQGFCASIAASFADAARERKLSAFTAKLPLNSLEAWRKLREAETSFEDARTRNEVDLSGTGRAAFQFEEQGLLRDQFLINAQQWASGKVRSTTADELSELDANLNKVYKALQTTGAGEYTTVTPSGIKITERAWLRLMDAWLDFTRVAYPKLSSTNIRAQLIRLRLHQLRSLAS